jgi:NADP-reducing hydrogenase subunit HndB
VKSREELQAIRERAKASLAVRDGQGQTRVVIAMGTCGIAAGAREIMTTLLEDLAQRSLNEVTVSQTGCKGLCDKEPMVEVHLPDGSCVTYGGVTPLVMRRIVAEHIVNGRMVREYAIGAGTEEQ